MLRKCLENAFYKVRKQNKHIFADLPFSKICELPNLLEQDFQVVAAAFAVLSPDPEARGVDWVHHFFGFLQFRFFRLLQMNFRSFCRTCAWKNMEEPILNGTIMVLFDICTYLEHFLLMERGHVSKSG